MDGCVIAFVHIRIGACMGVWMYVYRNVHVCTLAQVAFRSVLICVRVCFCVRACMCQSVVGFHMYAFCCALQLYCTAVALFDI